MPVTATVKLDKVIFTSMQHIPSAVLQSTFKYFKDITPRKTGNAKRNTRLKKGQSINVTYDYFANLDKGSSPQAPDGMTGPAEEFMQTELNNRISKIK
jgi:hypothetical protein